MRILVIGATGYIGDAVVKRLVAAGKHEVLGIARSEEKGQALRALQVEPVICAKGFDDPGIPACAATCEAVIDASAGSFRKRAVMAEEIVKQMQARGGPKKFFLATTGTNFYGHVTNGPATEALPYNGAPQTFAAWPEKEKKVQDTINEWWVKFEEVMLQKAPSAGLLSTVVRPSYVYGNGIGGLGGGTVSEIKGAKKAGQTIYVGDGSQKSGTVHVDEIAELYQLLLDKPDAWKSGDSFICSSGEVTQKEKAEVVASVIGGKVVQISLEEAQAKFGFTGADGMVKNSHTTSQKAKTQLGWNPNKISLLEEFKVPVFAKL